jgi:carbon monoxide dehydrogenase subunit G
MKVDGNVTMSGPQQAVYDTLSDPEVLRQCLPGCEKFDEVGEGRYETVLKAGVAGVKGTFTGTVTLSDAKAPESYTLTIQGTFSGGFVKGVGNISLAPEDDGNKTKVSYLGDGQVGGPLASVGQRLMAPAARMVVGQFFRCMDGKLKSRQTEGAGTGD